MSKLQESLQCPYNTYIFKCWCGEDSYLEVMQDPQSRELYINITKAPTRLKERLMVAYKALRGIEFSASNSVIIDEKDADKLIDALRLSQRLPQTKKPTQTKGER